MYINYNYSQYHVSNFYRLKKMTRFLCYKHIVLDGREFSFTFGVH